jgi:hypothetical protein
MLHCDSTSISQPFSTAQSINNPQVRIARCKATCSLDASGQCIRTPYSSVRSTVQHSIVSKLTHHLQTRSEHVVAAWSTVAVKRRKEGQARVFVFIPKRSSILGGSTLLIWRSGVWQGGILPVLGTGTWNLEIHRYSVLRYYATTLLPYVLRTVRTIFRTAIMPEARYISCPVPVQCASWAAANLPYLKG